jgi:flagellar protein FlgJ
VSISPSSDILLGVAKAADPQKYRAAVEKLARASGTTPAEAESAMTAAIASAAAQPTAGGAGPRVQGASGVMGETFRSAFPQDAAGKAKKSAEKEFEAFFLQTVVDSMLPKDAKALFGSGPAGNIWKSMLAEQLANELAKSTSFGIAEQIAESRAMKGKDKDKSKAAPALSPSESAAKSVSGAPSGHAADLRRLLSAEGALALDALGNPAANVLTTGS